VNSAAKWLQKVMSAGVYLFYLAIIVVLFDVLVLHGLVGFGYPKHYAEENIQRYPAPYVMFTGKPLALDHNSSGFRGHSLQDVEDADLRIAFFGGSTGYGGNPTIPAVIEEELSELTGLNVAVSNYSVVSSNHRQHLHGMLEYLPTSYPDLVVFYGGHNETVQSGKYDPRPGYPYNHFYRGEAAPMTKLLMENSAIAGELDKRFGWFTELRNLQAKYQPFSEAWNEQIAEKYLETLELAQQVSGILRARHIDEPHFLAFYQPFQVPALFQKTHDEIRRRLAQTAYAIDVSSVYDDIKPSPFRDAVHVNQAAHERMGEHLAGLIAKHLDAWDIKTE
jgi:lysophospholipase L1-like esterase